VSKALAALAGLLILAPAAQAQLPRETIAAREHFFGAGNVDAAGKPRADKVILSWFSVGSLAMAIDGHVVLLDTYIHKGEAEPNYVPTTTDELVALKPEAIFIGHGHFDHANTAGQLAVRTNALVMGTPEHCDQVKAQAEEFAGEPVLVNCVEAVPRASDPGALTTNLRPLGKGVGVTILKHLHSAAVPPDGEGHETSLAGGAVPDAAQVLLHPPGPGTVAGLATSGDEGWSLLYQFHVGRFRLTWHDSVGPLRENAPQVLPLLEKLPPTDVELGSTLGFNDPTNGQRDPVDYLVRIKPKIFLPLHHDFIAEYGASKSLEGVFRRELAKRDPVATDVRWLYDPQDYLRPSLMTFDVARDPACLRGRLTRKGFGRVRLGRRAVSLGRRGRWCVQGRKATVLVLYRRGRVALVAVQDRGHLRYVSRLRGRALRRALSQLR
jgi:hypothetical protein